MNVGIYQGVITKCLALNPSARSLPEAGWFDKVRPSFGDGIKAALKPENHAKWSEVWPMVSESAGASAQLKLKLTYNTVFIFYYDISWGQTS